MELIIMLPMYNDWDSFRILLKDLEKEFPTSRIVVVDDGSSQQPGTFTTSSPLDIIKLTHNLGHQKAIAIGLSYVAEKYPASRVLIMDADGNDTIADAVKLQHLSHQNPDKIILAKRKKRNESGFFKMIYQLYLWIFRLLTGRSIRYGNFCLLPVIYVQKIVHLSNIWLHLPAAIVKSGFPNKELDTSKGERLQGKSKMNVTSFLFHGLGAIAVFTDIIALRLLITSIISIFISVAALVTIIFIKFSTNLAIPGWASAVGSSLIIIILLSFLMSVLLIFIFIISQSSRKFIPAIHYKDYLQSAQTN